MSNFVSQFYGKISRTINCEITNYEQGDWWQWSHVVLCLLIISSALNCLNGLENMIRHVVFKHQLY